MSQLVQLNAVRERREWSKAIKVRDAYLINTLEQRFELALHELAKEGGVTPDYLRRLLKQAAK